MVKTLTKVNGTIQPTFDLIQFDYGNLKDVLGGAEKKPRLLPLNLNTSRPYIKFCSSLAILFLYFNEYNSCQCQYDAGKKTGKKYAERRINAG